MNREQKIQQTFRLVEAIVGGYASQVEKRLSGLTTNGWIETFENCYEGVDVMLKRADEMNSLFEKR